ncbi:hypothetical protein B0H13DRAFT_1925035 [Mycena leptocephala]|nr:hypothetical protein B0H13DRAFT_1925035 [Mycena leptocephala]
MDSTSRMVDPVEAKTFRQYLADLSTQHGGHWYAFPTDKFRVPVVKRPPSHLKNFEIPQCQGEMSSCDGICWSDPPIDPKLVNSGGRPAKRPRRSGEPQHRKIGSLSGNEVANRRLALNPDILKVIGGAIEVVSGLDVGSLLQPEMDRLEQTIHWALERLYSMAKEEDSDFARSFRLLDKKLAETMKAYLNEDDDD